MRWLFLKDLRILGRSPLIVALLIAYPIVIAAFVGFAIESAPSKPRVALLNELPPSSSVVDLGGQSVNVVREARPLLDAIHAVRVRTRAEAERRVRDGDVLAAIVIPPDIASQLQSITSGSAGSASVEVLYNAEDPAKQGFVEDTIKARVQDANAALTQRISQVALRYLNLIATGGQFSFLGSSFDVIGLQRSAQTLASVERQLPPRSPLRAQVASVQRFAQLARDNISLAGPLLQSIGNPITVQQTVVSGAAPPLGAFATAVAATVTLMLVTLLLAAGTLALEREENVFLRLVRGLVSRGRLIAEKTGLAAACSAPVALILIAALSAFVALPWSRAPLWVLASALGALAFGALGTAIGALTREVRAASLVAFMASLPIAVLALVPSGSVSGGVYTLVRVISAAFPFRATLDALDSALGRSGGMVGPLLHLVALTLAFLAVARIAIRRFER